MDEFKNGDRVMSEAHGLSTYIGKDHVQDGEGLYRDSHVILPDGGGATDYAMVHVDDFTRERSREDIAWVAAEDYFETNACCIGSNIMPVDTWTGIEWAEAALLHTLIMAACVEHKEAS